MHIGIVVHPCEKSPLAFHSMHKGRMCCMWLSFCNVSQSVPPNILLASSTFVFFTTSQDLLALGLYPYPGPILINWSHQLRTSASDPPPVASSAKHTCLIPVGCSFRSSVIIPTAYILMARGSPCVVPSSDISISPQYVF